MVKVLLATIAVYGTGKVQLQTQSTTDIYIQILLGVA